MPPTPSPTDFRTLLAALIPALTASGPNSQDVVQLVQQAKEQFPAHAGQIDSLVAAWREMAAPAGSPPLPTPATAATPPPAPSNWSTLLTHGGSLSIGAVATLIIATVDWSFVGSFIVSMTENPGRLGLLVVVALGGVIGGLVNAYFAGNIGLLPQTIHLGSVSFQGFGKSLNVSVLGLLGNLLTSLIGAVVAVWIPLWSQSGDAQSRASYISSFVGAIAVGAFGARALTGLRDKNLLMGALQQALAGPRNEILAHQVGNVPVIQAVEMVTGRTLTTGSAAPVVDVAAAQTELLNLLDLETLGPVLSTEGPPGKHAALTRDSAGMPMQALKAVKNSAASLPKQVGDMKIAAVARMKQDIFRASVAALGDGGPAEQNAADEAQKAAQKFLQIIGNMPLHWQFAPPQ